MRLATFNLYQYLKPPLFWYENKPQNRYSDSGWASKKRWIKSQLTELDADVVGFQEVFSHEDLQALVNDCGYSFFHVGDGPDPVDSEDDQVRHSPRVAIASRFPLESVQAVPLSAAVVETLNLKADFRFSRQPIAATVSDPEMGPVRILVAHLKSKRPMVDEIEYPEATPWKNRALDSMQRTSRGNTAALLQRGAEASMLYHYFSEYAAENPDVPVAVLGDLNDEEGTIVMDSLTMQGWLYDIGTVPSREWPRGISAYLHSLRLKDSFSMSLETQTELKPFTHIYQKKEGVLDYVLLSNHFRPHHTSPAKVVEFTVLNQHLLSDGVGDKHQSDHGQVVVEIHKQSFIPGDGGGEGDGGEPGGMTRQEFVDLAGGVYQSNDQYEDWRRQDKYDGFWRFFFDTDRGWVKSVYGSIPIEELYQLQRYSIEHIIPKSFLKNYLGSKGRANGVRYGATVNPLNFVAAERDINSSRSSFPFDMDGDRVERPFRIHLNPDAYGSTGLDHENEWVIPSGSRGEIARSILYMVLVYEIDELYNRHVDTLVHWAKVDPATSWEIAYNQWVKSRLGIHNPFIDTPENALVLLNDAALVRSVVVGTD